MHMLSATLLPVAALAAFSGDLKFPDFGELGKNFKTREMFNRDGRQGLPKFDGLNLDGVFGGKRDKIGKKEDAGCLKTEDELNVSKVLLSDPASVSPNSAIEWKVTITNERESRGSTKGYPAKELTAKDTITGATDISIRDNSAPDLCEFNSDFTMAECTLEKLADGESWMFTVKATVTAEIGDPVCNTVVVESKCSDPETAEVCTPVTCPPDNLNITKEGPSGTIALNFGTVLPYTITVSNEDAPNPARMVELTDTIPAGFEYNFDAICSIPCVCNQVNTNLVCTVDTLPPDFVLTVDYTITPVEAIFPPDGIPGRISVENTATVVSFCDETSVTETFSTEVCIPGAVAPSIIGSGLLGGLGGEFETDPETTNAFVIEYTARFADGPGAVVELESFDSDGPVDCTLTSLNQVSSTTVIVSFNCAPMTNTITPVFSVTRSQSSPLPLEDGDQTRTVKGTGGISVSEASGILEGQRIALSLSVADTGLGPFATFDTSSIALVYSLNNGGSNQQVLDPTDPEFCPLVTDTEISCQVPIGEDGFRGTGPLMALYVNVVVQQEAVQPDETLLCDQVSQEGGLQIGGFFEENCVPSLDSFNVCVQVDGPVTSIPEPECIWVLNDNGNAACQGVCQAARLFSNGCQGGTGFLALECDNSCASKNQPLVDNSNAMEEILSNLVDSPYCNVNDDNAPPGTKTDFAGVCVENDSPLKFFPENGSTNNDNIIAPAVAFDGDSNTGDVKGCLFVGPDPVSDSTCETGAIGLGNTSEDNQGDNGAMIERNDDVARLCCCILAATPGENNQKCPAA
uniref:DUF11 domain-containing protein n=1 Tax=Chromera velia CCMP2878 TaxID=1169474 RepID=A0A0G4GY01_9ALVE|eukprot:Cvel_23850.t1-p1 / transcript=Cvel_23850.t1 / gene=Cvel_23850 / organism=Chromera_velia_CCMP2878 / gene_product=hypothetical protein / transcript_product=hypothetical protein / location=Cvel_scaffold2509:6324-12847(+) / protein_length=802 / sequence_SO=supercontig / SO=protein_coding / is_pseudo=false